MAAWLLVTGLPGWTVPEAEVRTVFRVEARQPSGWNLWVGDRDLGAQRMVPGMPALTPDGLHLALVTSPAGPDPLFRLLIDGRPAGEWTVYEDVRAPQLRNDGGAWAAAAWVPGPGGSRAVTLVDGQAYGPFRSSSAVVWAPRGAGWYFDTETDKGRGLVANGRSVGPFQGRGEPAWDPSGTKLAFTFTRNGAQFFWADGQEAGPFSNVWLITRPDGAWLGYTAAAKDGRFTVFLGGKAYGPYDWIDPQLDWISPDGRAWKSRCYKKGVPYLLDTGRELQRPSLDFQRLPDGTPVYRWGGFQNWSVDIGGQVFGPCDGPTAPLQLGDGSAWAFQYGSLPGPGAEGTFVQIQGQKPFPGTGLRLVRDPSGEAFTWFSGGRDGPLTHHRWTREGVVTATVWERRDSPPDGWMLAAGGKEYGPYEAVGSPAVTADGLHWGVLCRLTGGRWAALVDGVLGPAAGPADNAMDLVLSENGASWGYRYWPVKGSDQQKLVLGGREWGPYRSAGPVSFSSDGKHGMAWVQAADGKSFLLFDGRSYGPGAQGQNRHFFDLEAGHFVVGLPAKGGLTAVTDEGTFGPYRDLGPVSLGVRDSDTGFLLGFVGTLPDGRQELRVVSGPAGGGKTYGPYRRIDPRPAVLSAGGREWIFAIEKTGVPGQWYLRNGTEVQTDGYGIRALGSGSLMLVRSGGKESLLRDGQPLGTWTRVFDWSAARDGQTWVAHVQEGEGPGARDLVVVSGRAEPGNSLARSSGPGGDRYTWFSLTEGEGQVHTLTVK